MNSLTHGFRIQQDRCNGCLACMRACPTRSIRVRDGKAVLLPEQCIDCGVCLRACRCGAITATTFSMQDLDRFRFKVAVPSPVLFGQFPTGISDMQIARGLKALGFDAVWNYTVEIGLVRRAIRDYVARWQGAFPLISVACPVVVRLVQVSYPRMIDQLIRVQLPREIAAREAKRLYAARLGLRPEEVAAIYITPCQAKTVSILQPAEGAQSHLDGALGISEVYNALVASAVHDHGEPSEHLVHDAAFLRWPLSEGLSRVLSRCRYLSVTGLSNIIQVFDDIEIGRLRNVGFVEAHNCWSGCSGGNLTVANLYVTLSKLRSMIGQFPDLDDLTCEEIDRRYPAESLAIEGEVRPRPQRHAAGNLKQRVRIVREAEAIAATLPGLDCGLCGAPTCTELAHDISLGEAAHRDCLFFSRERIRELQQRYLGAKRDADEAGPA